MQAKLTETPVSKAAFTHAASSRLIFKPPNNPLPHPEADSDTSGEDFEDDAQNKGDSNEEIKEEEQGNDLWDKMNEEMDGVEDLRRMSFEERLRYFANRKKERSINVAMEMLADEQTNCTFTPRVNSCTRRNLKQFLKDQERFLDNRTSKQKQLSMQLLEKEMMTVRSSPRINPESAFMGSVGSAKRSQSKGNLSASQNVFKRSRTADKNRNKSQKISLDKDDIRLQRELGNVLNLHNPHSSLIAFPAFRRLCCNSRQYTQILRHAQALQRGAVGTDIIQFITCKERQRSGSRNT
eukprot:TRINITY_DN9367_c0_g2_i6.p2 TRINITY_DN9367_c0_g2~~TRINITY_DN9367_c0_g2_i6.p2  ORF type:complete len:295 (+),score=38.14 TRINITY_DN9367_c0_g2_i6:50-934(+)